MRDLPKQYNAPSISIQDTGPSGRELALLATAGSTITLTIAVSIAVLRVAQGVMWAIIILSAGAACQMVLSGIGIYHLYRSRGEALVIEAKATLIDARRGNREERV
jgi:hypothetical protein